MAHELQNKKFGRVIERNWGGSVSCDDHGIPAGRPQTFQRFLKVLPQTWRMVSKLTKGYAILRVSAVSTGIEGSKLTELKITAHSLGRQS